MTLILDAKVIQVIVILLPNIFKTHGERMKTINCIVPEISMISLFSMEPIFHQK